MVAIGGIADTWYVDNNIIPVCGDDYLCGTAGLRKRVPSASMNLPIRSAMPWSKPLSSMDRTMTVASMPSPVRKPCYVIKYREGGKVR